METMRYNILEYGALPDGRTLCTAAIQKAIDRCSEQGGGTVVVPGGRYRVGTIFLKSNVELHLEAGSMLCASENLDDYNADDAYAQNFGCANEQWNAKHLIIAHEVEHVALTGDGVIDGSAEAFFAPAEFFSYYCWTDGLALSKDKMRLRPGQMVVFVECRHVRVENVTFRNSTCWCCFFHGCDYVSARGLSIFNPRCNANTDGIDIDSCSHVTVSDCVIDTGDDAIAIRGSSQRLSDPKKKCEYITITNCVLSSASSVFRIGVGTGDIEHVRISNLVVKSGSTCFNFMSNWPQCDTGIRDVHISDVTAREVGYPLAMYGGENKGISDVTIENFRVEASAKCEIWSNSIGNVKNITLRNLDIYEQNAYGELTDEILNERGRSLLVIHNARNVILDGVSIHADASTLKTWSKSIEVSNCPGLGLKEVRLP